jgi:hypothetical protein
MKEKILDYIFDKFGERFSEMSRCGYSQDDIVQKNYWRITIKIFKYRKDFVREAIF